MKNFISRELRNAKYFLAKLLGIRIIRVILVLIFIAMITPLIVFFFLRPKPHPNIEYGITFSNKYASELGLDWKDTYLGILDNLKVKNLRLVAYWDEIEEIQGNFDYSIIKWQLDEAEKRNLNVILTVGRKVPRFPECFEPNWWKEIQDEDTRDQKLYKYIEQSINELKNYKSIKMWQIENEPFFPFGECLKIRKETVMKEVEITKSLDSRPILIQDSGEGGFWFPSYQMADYLAISMYRKIWYDFWGAFLGNFIYFKYPLAHWSYKIKADFVGVPFQKIIVTELQAEPWGPGINSKLTEDEKNHTMSRNDFLATISYAQKAGFKYLYMWGVEWWYWEKEQNNNPFYWDTVKSLIN
ncbi:hypothetical protein JXA34_02550 [Patescibacteria group bacterium]|nr:hypothetical protein [Patescibacteria group bacterium]